MKTKMLEGSWMIASIKKPHEFQSKPPSVTATVSSRIQVLNGKLIAMRSR